MNFLDKSFRLSGSFSINGDEEFPFENAVDLFNDIDEFSLDEDARNLLDLSSSPVHPSQQDEANIVGGSNDSVIISQQQKQPQQQQQQGCDQVEGAAQQIAAVSGPPLPPRNRGKKRATRDNDELGEADLRLRSKRPTPPLSEDQALRRSDTSPWILVVSPDEVVKHAVTTGKTISSDIRVVKQSLESVLHNYYQHQQHQDHVPVVNPQVPAISDEIQRLLVEVEEIRRQLRHLLDRSYLGCSGKILFMVLRLDNEYLAFQLQLTVWQQELELAVSSAAAPAERCANANSSLTMTACVASQPMPCTVQQRKRLEEPVIVRVFRSVRHQNCPVTVQMTVRYCNGNSATSAGSGATEDAAAAAAIAQQDETSSSANNMDLLSVPYSVPVNSRGVAVFDNIELQHSTRKRPVELVFRAVMDGGDDRTATASIPPPARCVSRPLVVITRDEFFVQAEGALLRYTLFDEPDEPVTPWEKFCNFLSFHYIRCTKQDDPQSDPGSIRFLAPPELEMFQRHFFPKIQLNSTGGSHDNLQSSEAAAVNCGNLIGRQEFDKFWNWFSAALQVIRRDKPMDQLFQQGLMAGFISRPDAEKVLMNDRTPGTFLLRFAGPRPETSPGTVVISYVESLSESDSQSARQPQTESVNNPSSAAAAAAAAGTGVRGGDGGGFSQPPPHHPQQFQFNSPWLPLSSSVIIRHGELYSIIRSELSKDPLATGGAIDIKRAVSAPEFLLLCSSAQKMFKRIVCAHQNRVTGAFERWEPCDTSDAFRKFVTTRKPADDEVGHQHSRYQQRLD